MNEETIALVRRIESRGIDLRPDRINGRVLYRPVALMPDDLGAELAASKWAVIGYLESRDRVDSVLDKGGEHSRLDLRDLYEERAAIMEFDGGLPRDVAEEHAWLDLGEELIRRRERLAEQVAEVEARWAAEDARRAQERAA